MVTGKLMLAERISDHPTMNNQARMQMRIRILDIRHIDSLNNPFL
jgi:hypothetical protein